MLNGTRGAGSIGPSQEPRAAARSAQHAALYYLLPRSEIRSRVAPKPQAGLLAECTWGGSIDYRGPKRAPITNSRVLCKCAASQRGTSCHPL
jgi:hypothetical protein